MIFQYIQLEPKGRILIAEDELLVAENMKEALQASHFAVVGILATGEEVIAQFKNLDPDLVVMDIHLAGLIDGIQTAAVIHYTLKQIPILFVTAYAEDHFPQLENLNSQLTGFLTKPYDRGQLIDYVAQLLKV